MFLLENESQFGKYYFGQYAKVTAFGFAGDKDFVNRNINLCMNHQIGKSKSKTIHPEFGEIHYFLTTHSNLQRRIKEYLVNEIKYNKQFLLINESYNDEGEYNFEYNEEEIDKLAAAKTENFINNIIINNFILQEKAPIPGNMEMYVHTRIYPKSTSGPDLEDDLIQKMIEDEVHSAGFMG